jgi:signal transduction histidine kinase
MLVRDWERIDAETKRELLDDIATQGYRLGVLVENMVQLAHIRAGRRRMELEPVQVERLIRTAIDAVRRLTGGRRVTLRADPQLIAEVDADRIEQVVTNLLHNAVKYSPPGTPVDVEANRQGDEIMIAVRDYGSGIDAVDMPYIFDRFRRAASAEASAAPGMGLGLYLARHVVEVHGGRIWAEQPAGSGTRVCFTVPALDAE